MFCCGKWDGEIIEWLCTIIVIQLGKGKPIHLEDLIVKKNKRGTGAGFALYKEIIKQGKAEKCLPKSNGMF